MSENSFFGMSGHYAVLSLLLRRGYNVAVPAVDVGDDAIVIDDGAHELRRLQIKSGTPSKPVAHATVVVFKLSRKQLRDSYGAPLFYMLMAWIRDRWSFVLIPREELEQRKARRQELASASRRRKHDEQARSDALNVTVTFHRDPLTREEDATLWGESLREYLNRWTADWPELQPGQKAPAPPPSERP